MKLALRTTLAVMVALTGLAGCGDDDSMMMGMDAGPGTDSGMGTDTGMGTDSGTDSGGGGECDARAETLTMGAQTLTGDTTGRASALALGDCGDAPAPQEILALTLPGSGDLAVTFTLDTEGTAEFDSVVQLRPTSCTSAADAVCFDDAGGSLLSGGTFIAEGGSTVHLIVSGFGADDAGAWQMDLDVAAATAPTLESGSAYTVDGDRFELELVGGDAEGNALFYEMQLLDDADAEIPIAALDGETTIQLGFLNDLEGQTSFTALSSLSGLSSEVPEFFDATSVRVTVFDATDLASDPLTLPMVALTSGGPGATCDDRATVYCEHNHECTDSTCSLTADGASACGGAASVTLAPGAATVTATETASLEPGDGALRAACGATLGDEALFEVTVPAAHDLIVTTDKAANEGVDSVVYVMETCGSAADESRCNDDISDENLLSAVTLLAPGAGTYTVAVESFGGVDEATDIEVDISLRPVLAAGLPCDDAEVMNRCADGACTGGTCPAAE